MQMPILTLYTRTRCPLCEQAEKIIAQLKEEMDFSYVANEIDHSDEWTEKYGLMIPVIEINQMLVQYGQIDYFTIKEALEAN